MTVSTKVLVNPLLLASTQTTLYTTAPNVKAIIDKATVTNTHPTMSISVSVNLVPASGVASATNLIVDARVIAAGETLGLANVVGHNLAVGDSISAIAGTAAALSLRVSGREIS